MSFRRHDPPQESQGANVRASIRVVRESVPILTAQEDVPERGHCDEEEK
jgi:hypothetical protein